MRDTIANYSKAVRGSTIKRLQSIPIGYENWQISETSMSIADIAQHLVDADNWLFEKLENHKLEPIIGKAGTINFQNRSEFNAMIGKLVELGETRYDILMGDLDFGQLIFDSRFDRDVTILWIVLRGNLDHEVHHRGQLSAYLRAIRDMTEK